MEICRQEVCACVLRREALISHLTLWILSCRPVIPGQSRVCVKRPCRGLAGERKKNPKKNAWHLSFWGFFVADCVMFAPSLCPLILLSSLTLCHYSSPHEKVQPCRSSKNTTGTWIWNHPRRHTAPVFPKVAPPSTYKAYWSKLSVSFV